MFLNKKKQRYVLLPSYKDNGVSQSYFFETSLSSS